MGQPKSYAMSSSWNSKFTEDGTLFAHGPYLGRGEREGGIRKEKRKRETSGERTIQQGKQTNDTNKASKQTKRKREKEMKSKEKKTKEKKEKGGEYKKRQKQKGQKKEGEKK